jgi:hypothetical protein
MYRPTPPKPDNPSEEKYYYLCQTRGCGAVINEGFPVGLKTPSPVRCANCHDKETRKAIEAEHDILNPKVETQLSK